MRSIGVVALLLAVAALLMSVTKAERHRHDEPGCACCSLDAETVGTSALSFESAHGSDMELATNCGTSLKTDAEAPGTIAMTAGLGHEAVLRHAVHGCTDCAHDSNGVTPINHAEVTNERVTLRAEAEHDIQPSESPVSGDYHADTSGRESEYGRCQGVGV